MSKTAVIYQYHYGYTQKYAEWLAKDLAADLYNGKAVKPSDLQKYDILLFGGGLYAGGINGISVLSKNYEALKNKNIAVFTCGLADPNDEENAKGLNGAIKKVFSPEMLNNITVFHLRGGIDYSKLSLLHKSMMAMLHKMIQKKSPEELTKDEQGILATYGQTVDFCDRSTIAPLLNWARRA
ncbi:MAG: flavodoxin domain-containing protein [Clostridia bacterium]|nr:flavodoxin domain-containing protein [Clostridia bacterium]